MVLIFLCCKIEGFGMKLSAQNCSGISEMCRLRILMLTQKSHFYSVQLSEEEVRPCKAKTLSVHVNGSVRDKLFTQTALCKWLCR